MTDTESKVGGRALQLWLTVLVAMLLGSLGWFSVTVIQLQNDLVKLRTQFEERGARIEEIYKTQQMVKDKLLELREADLRVEFDLKQLKAKSP